MSTRSQARMRAGVVLVTPVIVLLGFAWAPYITDFTDNAAVAAEIAADTTRWTIATLIAACGLALTPALAVSIRSYLRSAGEQRWSFIAVPLIAAGAVMLAFFTGSDFAVAQAIDAGASGEAVLEEREDWFVPVFTVSMIVFAVGWLCLAQAIRSAAVLSRTETRVVVAALVVLAVSLFIPLTGGQYLVGIAALVASWIMGRRMWSAVEAEQGASPA